MYLAQGVSFFFSGHVLTQNRWGSCVPLRGSECVRTELPKTYNFGGYNLYFMKSQYFLMVELPFWISDVKSQSLCFAYFFQWIVIVIRRVKLVESPRLTMDSDVRSDILGCPTRTDGHAWGDGNVEAKMLSFRINTWRFTHEIRVRNGDVTTEKCIFYCEKGRVGQKKVEISHDLSSKDCKDWLFTRQPWEKT